MRTHDRRLSSATLIPCRIGDADQFQPGADQFQPGGCSRGDKWSDRTSWSRPSCPRSHAHTHTPHLIYSAMAHSLLGTDRASRNDRGPEKPGPHTPPRRMFTSLMSRCSTDRRMMDTQATATAPPPAAAPLAADAAALLQDMCRFPGVLGALQAVCDKGAGEPCRAAARSFQTVLTIGRRRRRRRCCSWPRANE